MSKDILLTIVTHSFFHFLQAVNISEWIKFLAEDPFQNFDITSFQTGLRKASEIPISPATAATNLILMCCFQINIRHF